MQFWLQIKVAYVAGVSCSFGGLWYSRSCYANWPAAENISLRWSSAELEKVLHYWQNADSPLLRRAVDQIWNSVQCSTWQYLGPLFLRYAADVIVIAEHHRFQVPSDAADKKRFSRRGWSVQVRHTSFQQFRQWHRKLDDLTSSKIERW